MPNNNQPSDTKKNNPTQDYLWQHLFELPYFRALLRAVEARFYYDIDLPAPVLDVGCGDGHFATVAFDHQLDVGLDPWSDPIREAAQRGGYHSLVQADGGRMPFPDRYFGSAISNSVLEHIPDIEDVLKDVQSCPETRRAFCVQRPQSQLQFQFINQPDFQQNGALHPERCLPPHLRPHRPPPSPGST